MVKGKKKWTTLYYKPYTNLTRSVLPEVEGPVCSSATLLSEDVKPESGLLNVLEHGGHGAHHLRPAGPALPPPHPLHPACC